QLRLDVTGELRARRHRAQLLLAGIDRRRLRGFRTLPRAVRGDVPLTAQDRAGRPRGPSLARQGSPRRSRIVLDCLRAGGRLARPPTLLAPAALHRSQRAVVPRAPLRRLERPSEQPTRRMTGSPSIGIFLGRPDRGARLAAKLRERGFPVVHYNHRGFDGEPYVPVDARALTAVAHVLLRTDHDVYLTGLSHVPGVSLYLNHALRRKPYVFNETSLNWESFHDRSKRKPFPLLFEHAVHPFLLRRTYAGATRIVCNSHFLAARMAAHYPTFRGRVTTIYNGIDVERYAEARATRTSSVRPRQVVLACVTTLNLDQKSHGLDLVLDAFGRVHARRPETRLAIATKFSDPVYLDRFRRTLEDRPWRDAVTLYQNHPRVEDVLAGADLFVYATPNGSDSLPR